MKLRVLDVIFLLTFVLAIFLFIKGATGPLANHGKTPLPEELLVYCIFPMGTSFLTVFLSKVKYLTMTAIISSLVMAAVYGKMLLIP